MRCPFLMEAEVRFCEASPFRKMLPVSRGDSEPEPCSDPEHVRCPWAPAVPSRPPVGGVCPWLRKASVHFCSAARRTQFVPYSESLTSSCQTWSHEYCDLYLSLSRPRRSKAARSDGSSEIEMPAHLAYARNHLWLDRREDESCHIGVDAFLANLVGVVDAVDFVQARGVCRPSVVLAVGGSDLRLVFPNTIHVTRVNAALRADPIRIVEDPYGRGWLISGSEVCAAGSGTRQADAGLLRGEQARRWMDEEIRRAARFAHEIAAEPRGEGGRLACDGGFAASRLAIQLARPDLLRLFASFFSLEATSEAW